MKVSYKKMNKDFRNLLLHWSLPYIRDVDIGTAISNSEAKRYAIVNRAIKNETLLHLRRGLYLIQEPYRKKSFSHFQLAHSFYGPSYVSFESALFYHQWIPEAVYTMRCATAKRSKKFATPIGEFQYSHVPATLLYLGVTRIGNNNEAFLVAEPWKALADHYYAFCRNWNSVEDLCSDLRIEMEDMLESDLDLLQTLSENYQNHKVRIFLSKILLSLKKWK